MILKTVADLRALARGWRAAGEVIGVVPTMGALHDGHLSLARRARAECDRVITTIFVNPKQFNNPDDLKKYPRALEADADLLSGVPVDVVFAPGVDEVYPDGFITTVSVGGVSEPLEGRMRPGHFDGVATVVTKLFGMTEANRGYFGQKDWQQLQVVTRLVTDLNLPVHIVGCETIREADGLAMSSRNRYLSDEHRALAPLLQRVMQDLAARIRNRDDLFKAVADAQNEIITAGFELDYLEARHAETLAPVASLADGPIRLILAARIGSTRLLDNIAV